VAHLIVGATLLNIENANIKEENGKQIFDGNATECALLMFSRRLLEGGVFLQRCYFWC